LSKSAEYRAKAVEHVKLAAEDVCEIHVRIAASYLALAAKEIMRELNTDRRTSDPTSFDPRERAPRRMRPLRKLRFATRDRRRPMNASRIGRR
jgi:hypothetical protein